MVFVNGCTCGFSFMLINDFSRCIGIRKTIDHSYSFNMVYFDTSEIAKY